MNPTRAEPAENRKSSSPSASAMTARAATAVLVLLLAPLLGGCIGESLHVALRVPAGETLRISGPRHVDGTLLVEQGGTLVLDGADLTVEQALVVEGTLAATRSLIAFQGLYQRQNLEVRAGAVASLVETYVVSARDVAAVGGVLDAQGGRIEAARLILAGGRLHAAGVAFALGPSTSGTTGGGPSLFLDGGALDVQNGTLAFAEGPGGLAVLGGGEASLRNLTLDLSPLSDRLGLFVDEGRLDLVGVTLAADPLDTSLVVQGGTARLVDTPLPREALPPQVTGGGRLEVGWTLTARVVSVPGNAPVAAANVSLRGAHAPEESAMTDEKGEARFVALEYVVGGQETRPRNPYVLVVDPAKPRGASPAFVVDRPTTVLVPVPAPG